VSFAEAIKTCFQKYAEFRGRAARPEFWWFFLLYYILIVAPLVPLIALGSAASDNTPFDKSAGVAGAVFAVLTGVAFLALIIPYLAAGTRRLHDTGKSGLWWLITFVPFGSIVLFVFWASVGDGGWNQYGPPPGVTAAEPSAPAGSLPPPPPPPMPRM
jgi:uncharacterized membrane protein YhaH (DUF805 family)